MADLTFLSQVHRLLFRCIDYMAKVVDLYWQYLTAAPIPPRLIEARGISEV